uniref:ALMS motif domain-containing protein n=1 Tax=Parascaris univalens TaxID=6257 RepID=A0A914ZUY0_PARUN
IEGEQSGKEGSFNKTKREPSACQFPSSCGAVVVLTKLNKKKQVVRTCLDCGTIRRFTINRNYLSRNEKTQLEMTSCGSREAID